MLDRQDSVNDSLNQKLIEKDHSHQDKCISYIGTYDDCPDDLKDNSFITGGYRIGYPGVYNGFRTLFMAHNETVNVWTHLLGKLFFLGVLIFVINTYP